MTWAMVPIGAVSRDVWAVAVPADRPMIETTISATRICGHPPGALTVRTPSMHTPVQTRAATAAQPEARLRAGQPIPKRGPNTQQGKNSQPASGEFSGAELRHVL